jgi:hypothetical protein
MAMTVATASLWRWVAGHIDDPLAPDSVAACRDALAGGAAAAVLPDARLCYART